MVEPATKRVLLIEDEPDLLRGLSDALRFEGLEVVAAQTGGEGIARAAQGAVDLVVLDLMLPDLNGFRVCEQLRAQSAALPIIILSARGQETDKVRGLEAGADDYVTKPFSVAELIARIRAIFRRSARAGGARPELLQIGNATVDLKKQLVSRNRRSEPLTFGEVELLRMLSERAGEPVSRDELLERIWGLDGSSTNRTVDNVIVKLRKKIEDDSRAPRHILTIYGCGYKLVP
ncbi:MAG: response regulator transcription factor [Proteobacteria bacterium]|nr:response regulator transcription factor [Pseudomonadota bacterium]